ncbi:hypothetical protein BDN67DRAFT_985753 [Paxillus ammoniavirescens]|nr:hypothetical protein BDN67DRAFT_985753 [Paxillus ammoniavirescens]
MSTHNGNSLSLTRPARSKQLSTLPSEEMSTTSPPLGSAGACTPPAHQQVDNNPDVYVEKLQRKWAQGPRLGFLTSHMEGYTAAALEGSSHTQEYPDSVVNQYFTQFHWKLKVSEDPPSSTTLGCSPSIPEMILGIEVEQKRRKVLAMRKSHKKIGLHVKPENDSWACLLAQLSGVTKKPRALPVHQRWSKDHFNSIVKDHFQQRCNTENKKGKDLTMFRDQVTCEYFLATDEDTQMCYAELAKEEGQAVLKHWEQVVKGPPSTDPVARQVMHKGVNHSTIPQNWQVYDKQKYKNVMCMFQDYLTMYYTEEECDAHKLPPSLEGTITFDDDTPADNNMPPDDTPDTPPDTNGNTPAVNLKRKSHTSPDRSNLDPPDTSSTETDTDPDNDNEATPCCSPLPFSVWKPQHRLGSKTSRRKPVKQTTVQQKCPATSHDEQHNIPLPDGDEGSQNAYLQDNPVGSQAAHNEQHDNPLSDGDESQNMHPQDNSCHVSPPHGDQGSEELTPPTNGNEQAEKPESHLDPTDHLPAKYQELLSVYVKLENSSGFSTEKGAAYALSSKARPEALHWWISRVPTGTPPIRSLDKFCTEFWTWWQTLQPKWRVLPVPLQPCTLHTLRDVAGKWNELDKPGLNGFLSVITTLKWWGLGILQGGGATDLWDAMLDDVHWVMDQIVDSWSSRPSPHSEPRSPSQKRPISMVAGLDTRSNRRKRQC